MLGNLNNMGNFYLHPDSHTSDYFGRQRKSLKKNSDLGVGCGILTIGRTELRSIDASLGVSHYDSKTIPSATLQPSKPRFSLSRE